MIHLYVYIHICKYMFGWPVPVRLVLLMAGRDSPSTGYSLSICTQCVCVRHLERAPVSTGDDLRL